MISGICSNKNDEFYGSEKQNKIKVNCENDI